MVEEGSNLMMEKRDSHKQVFLAKVCKKKVNYQKDEAILLKEGVFFFSKCYKHLEEVHRSYKSHQM